MAKYLLQGSYTLEGLKGVMKEGGTKRREALEKAFAAVGGKLEALYYAFGEDDFYIIAEMPDNTTAIAGSLVTHATGAAEYKTVVLASPEEMDEAVNKVAEIGAQYRPPGR